MTAKERLQQVVDDLSEDQAADLLRLLSQPRDLDGDALAQILDGIPGAYESAQRGLQEAREGRTVPLDELKRTRG